MRKLLSLFTVAILVVVLSACTADTTDLDNTISDLTATVNQLESDLEELEADTTALETDITTAQAALAAAQSELADAEAELIAVLGDLTTEMDDMSGVYVGYSWKDEDAGVLLEDASQKVETRLTLDADGNILDAKMLFWKLKDGSWYTRQDGTAHITADLSVMPVSATPGSSYAKGTSMFTVDTHDFMSLYAVEVDADGNAGFMFVDPVTRYQYEIYLPSGYDYTTTVGNVTVNGTPGGFIPTVRTSGSGLIKPDSWSELDSKNMFNISYFNHVMTDAGVFEGLSNDSTMQELLEAVGVMFTIGAPNELGLEYGRHSLGGWQGNYEAIEMYLIGKNVMDQMTLVDWEVARWGDAVNNDNFFGIDVVAGSTKTAQDSSDGIAGATVRMSRESTSFQRALVAAGVLTEEDVVKGRF